MERVRNIFQQRLKYQPLSGEPGDSDVDSTPGQTPSTANLDFEQDSDHAEFSWLDYSIFLLLGVAMLWAWNMFLAAGPYFYSRFESNEWVRENFQSSELSISTISNMGFVFLLTKMQAGASYPKRIMTALGVNMVVFTLLAISTRAFLDVSAKHYFGFLLVIVLAASMASGLCQNGIFAYVSRFGREEYTQAIMTGQAVAGVLPCIAEIVSVLSVPQWEVDDDREKDNASTSAFAYFLTATAISFLTLLAFLHLAARHRFPRHAKQSMEDSTTALLSPSEAPRKTVPLLTLLYKLRWLAAAVSFTFALSMVFPVFTQQIESVRPIESSPRLFKPETFIPLAFLFWNSGDLIGRLLTGIPALRLTHRPKIVLLLAFCRVLWIPLYLLCNIRGQGTSVSSDAFYLVVVQLGFGLTNGFIGSTCMMGAVDWVDVDEREPAGGFMGLCLVGGLTVGSLLSFLAAM